MRIRSIKPEFWRSLDIAALSIEDRLLFVGLWSYVDDNGVGVDRVPIIAAELFADDLSRDPRETLARVSDGIGRLSERGLVQRYSDDSRDYLAVTNWDRHQRIDKPNKPRYPLPTSENVTIRETLARHSRDPRETPAPGTGEQGNRGTDPPRKTRGGAGVVLPKARDCQTAGNRLNRQSKKSNPNIHISTFAANMKSSPTTGAESLAPKASSVTGMRPGATGCAAPSNPHPPSRCRFSTRSAPTAPPTPSTVKSSNPRSCRFEHRASRPNPGLAEKSRTRSHRTR